MAKDNREDMAKTSTTMRKDSTAAEDVAENFGQLTLGLDGAADTSAGTMSKTEDTPRTRYNLRSRDKIITDSKHNLSRVEDSSTGTKQASAKTYIPPHLRGKGPGKDIKATTTQQVSTDSKPPTRSRTRQRPTGKKSTNLDANAATFQPQEAKRAPPTPVKFISGGAKPQDVRFKSASPSKKDRNPHLHVLKRPSPSSAYLKSTSRTVEKLEKPQQLLVVLDLNGTLLHRKPKGGSTFVARPRVNEFIQYLLGSHRVMVWSSAKPENVNPMCQKLFDKEKHQQLVAVWARNTLRIPNYAYNSKVQVYKQLSWIWNDKTIQAKNADPTGVWDQSNTVLIDDSVEKAASEPQNLICLEEFTDRPNQRESDVLGQVVKYLETLKYERDVSAFMELMPFKYNPAEVFDWNV